MTLLFRIFVFNGDTNFNIIHTEFQSVFKANKFLSLAINLALDAGLLELEVEFLTDLVVFSGMFLVVNGKIGFILLIKLLNSYIGTFNVNLLLLLLVLNVEVPCKFNLFEIFFALFINELVVGSFDGNVVVHFHGEELSCFGLVFAEFALQVLEKGTRHDLHVSDFHSFEPDAPSSDDFRDFFTDGFAEHLSVCEHILHLDVGDAIAHHSRGH